MHYFVTGGTGFIGRYLVSQLLARGGVVHLLVRSANREKAAELRRIWSVSNRRLKVINGDLRKPLLGLKAGDLKKLTERIDHFFHLAALYDLASGNEDCGEINIRGTAHALDLAVAIKAGCFHHISSVAVAGLYEGTFREDMFEEAVGFNHPYFFSKFEAEKLVRQQQLISWRIYRPGIVIGHSKTGEMAKVDGPYYFFKAIQRVRKALPQWFPAIGPEGGRVNLVPVDYVAQAIDHIAHVPGEDGGCFHLTDPNPLTVGETINLFAEAGHAPRMTIRLDRHLFGFIPPFFRHSITQFGPVRRIKEALLKELNIPGEVFRFLNYPTHFDNREAARVLSGSGISVPSLRSYAPVIWDYWERNLDPDLHKEKNLREIVENKVCVVTGASSGIGESTARKLADSGARVCLVARNRTRLGEMVTEIQQNGGNAYAYPADLSDMNACDQVMDKIIQEHDRIDVLINNAGRSIRRSFVKSLDRFHDYERTMQLNYFAPVRLTAKALPSMIKAASGHVINISSLGVLANAPRFSAYIASKAALEAFSRCVAAELKEKNIVFTTINMPLVRTPMIRPTPHYESFPALSADEAAELVTDALIKRPRRVATRLGVLAALINAAVPQLSEVIMSTAYRMFHDSPTTDHNPSSVGQTEVNEQSTLAALLKGISW